MVDPGATNATSAATSTVTWHGIQLSEGFDEAGNVAIAIWSKNGSSDLAEVINNAYAVLDAHQAYLAAHYTNNQFLGVSGLWDYHLASTELQTFPDPAGCTAYLLVQYAFQALTI